ncbi:hypothetical protein L7F22_046987 [Adiantum nelumboides]|nr:hypothetical protein [Adiantum nelumboides]
MQQLERKHALLHRRLKNCVEKKDVAGGRQVQELITRNGLDCHPLLTPLLIRLLVLSGRLQDAHHLFKALPEAQPSTWYAILHAYSKLGPATATLSLFQQMLHHSVEPHPHAFAAALKACSSSSSLEHGMVVHLHIVENGFESHAYLGSSLIDMYVRCVRLQDAQNVFAHYPSKSVFLFTALISGFAQVGQAHEALTLFAQMLQQGLHPSHVTYISVLKACCIGADLDSGQLCHTQIIEEMQSFSNDEAIGNILIDMYGKSESVKDALNIFNMMPDRSVVTWSTLLASYDVFSDLEEVLYIFQQMLQEGIEPGLVTYVGILSVCCKWQAQAKGKCIHAILVVVPHGNDKFVGNALVNMYAKCGNLQEARKVFDKFQKLDRVMWSTMLEAYAEQGEMEEVFILFTRMLQDSIEPDKVVFGSVLKVCIKVVAVDWGRYLHSLILEFGCETEVFLACTVIDMYSKCGLIEDGHHVFNKTSKRNVATWTALLSGYAQLGCFEEALHLYLQMQRDGLVPDGFAITAVLKASSIKGSTEDGELVHQQTFQPCGDINLISVKTLITHYVACGKIEDALQTFEQLGTQHASEWSIMIAGLYDYGHYKVALLLFHQMRIQGVDVDIATYVCVLKSCTKMVALEQGKFVHAQLDQKMCEADCILGNTLIDMYCKCGSLGNAEMAFNRLRKRDVVAWSSMIAGYAESNDYHTALQFFNSMRASGLKPNEVTYVSLLCACSNRGMMKEGCLYFASMKMEYDITPTLDHYNCMVDLCGRVGYLIEARDLLLTMPVLPDLVAWMSLLSHCRIHGRVEIGRLCYENLVIIDESHASSYELMLKLYVDTGQLQEAKEVEERRSHAHAQKRTAMAFIETSNNVSSFLVGGKQHERYCDISWRLHSVSKHIRELGFVPFVESVLQPDNLRL